MEYPKYSPLCGEFRGDLLDVIQLGHFCVTDESGKILWSAGDPDAEVFYRSSSKPLQALPALMRGLDKRYGLTQEEVAIFAGSHKGEVFHVRVLESIMNKTGLSEKMMVMNPTAPDENADYDGVPRKIYHNCSGKHLALMLLQRDLTGMPDGYHLMDSPAQKEVRRVLALLSGCAEESMRIAVDGCGVPVFSARMCEMANAFLRLASPELISDPILSEAASYMKDCMHAYPQMIRGSNSICLFMNQDPNIVAKSGAEGLYCIGLAKERMGIAVKLISGRSEWHPLVVRSILKQLEYDNPELMENLNKLKPEIVINNCGIVVGSRKFFVDIRKDKKGRT